MTTPSSQQAVAPVFERLSTEYKGVVTFCKVSLAIRSHVNGHTGARLRKLLTSCAHAQVDVDECAPIAKHYGVRAMPTFVFVSWQACNEEEERELTLAAADP